MLNGDEKVWIGNYVNQEEGMLFEVQMLTETKEEAYEKYVKYYRDEVMDWEGGENYALCSIDSLIEGRGVAELEADKNLSWFVGDNFFADGDHGIDDLDEEEQAALILGATGFQTFWKVTLPNIKWGLLYGVILCNARATAESTVSCI